MANPEQQGLKLTDLYHFLISIFAEMANPEQQGLKREWLFSISWS